MFCTSDAARNACRRRHDALGTQDHAEAVKICTSLHDVPGPTPQVTLSGGLRRFAAWVAQQPLPEDRLGEANAELAKRNMMG